MSFCEQTFNEYTSVENRDLIELIEEIREKMSKNDVARWVENPYVINKMGNILNFIEETFEQTNEITKYRKMKNKIIARKDYISLSEIIRENKKHKTLVELEEEIESKRKEDFDEEGEDDSEFNPIILNVC